MEGSSGWLARWRLRLSKTDIDVVHRAGVKNQDGDAVSRLQKTGAADTLLEEVLLLPVIDAKRDDHNILFIDANSNETIPLNAQDEKQIDTPLTVKKLILTKEHSEYFQRTTRNVG